MVIYCVYIDAAKRKERSIMDLITYEIDNELIHVMRILNNWTTSPTMSLRCGKKLEFKTFNRVFLDMILRSFRVYINYCTYYVSSACARV